MTGTRPVVVAAVAATIVLAALACLAAGCTKKTAAEPEAVEAGTAAPTASAASASAPTPPVSFDPNAPQPGDTLGTIMMKEAANRPHIQPNADDIYANLQKMGIAIGKQKQGLGRTYRASYCTGADTADGNLGVNICEYKDEAAAKAGVDVSQMPGVAGHRVLQHKATVLTLILRKTGSAAESLDKRVGDAYLAM